MNFILYLAVSLGLWLILIAFFFTISRSKRFDDFYAALSVRHFLREWILCVVYDDHFRVIRIVDAHQQFRRDNEKLAAVFLA